MILHILGGTLWLGISHWGLFDTREIAPIGTLSEDELLEHGLGVCDGCGCTRTIEQLRAIHPGVISCCPERKIVALSRGFERFECPACEYDEVLEYGALWPTCELCAADSGRSVLMTIHRPARVTDKPEGRDARKPRSTT
jgi:hypothetical protein